MKTQGIKNWKQLILIGILSAFAFPTTAEANYGSTMFGMYKHHHYVYYPKQNFYYDPYAYNYVIVENGVWVRQVKPPRMFAEININVLPHVDLYVDSYNPYIENTNHKHKYRLMSYMTPSASFYVFKLPVRFDFTITAYEYYEPVAQFVIVDYNPNFYCHPHREHGRGHGYGHGKHGDYYENYNHPPKGHGKDHKYESHEYGRYPGEFHQPGNNPKGGKNHGSQPGDFHKKNGPQPAKPMKNKGNGHSLGDFHQEKQPAPQQKNAPNNKHGNGGHNKINQLSAIGVQAMDKKNEKERDKMMRQKETKLKHQVDFLEKEEKDSY